MKFKIFFNPELNGDKNSSMRLFPVIIMRAFEYLHEDVGCTVASKYIPFSTLVL